MPIELASGGLFDSAHHDPVFAHGGNRQRSMASGIARTIRGRYTAMFHEYRGPCKEDPRRSTPGDCGLWKADMKPSVFNLATQE